MKIIRYQVGDTIRLRKKHPCGGNLFRVLRVGSDIRIVCIGCGRDMTLPRLQLEKATLEVKPCENQTEEKEAERL